MTSGYSRPSSLFTFSIAAPIAAAFSSLVKSVNGSLRNSVGIIAPLMSGNLKSAIRNPQFAILRRPLAGLLQLLDFAFDDLELERGHAIKKDDSVAVISFVQHAARRQFSS